MENHVSLSKIWSNSNGIRKLPGYPIEDHTTKQIFTSSFKIYEIAGGKS